jgi:hypothetical protein
MATIAQTPHFPSLSRATVDDSLHENDAIIERHTRDSAPDEEGRQERTFSWKFGVYHSNGNFLNPTRHKK